MQNTSDQEQTHDSAQPNYDVITESTPPQGPISHTIGVLLQLFYKRYYVALILLLVFSLYPAFHIKDLAFDSSLDRILVQEGKEMMQYQQSIQTFGPDKVAILYFEDPKIFTLEKLKILRKLAWDLQTYPKIQKVQSLFTTSFIHTQDETVYTEPAFQDLEKLKQDSDIKEILNALENDPLLKNRLYGLKSNSIIFILPILPEFKTLATVAKDLKKYLSPIEDNFEKAFLTGEPQIELFNEKEMKESQKVYLPLIALILLISFYFFIKSISAFFVTLGVTLISIFWSFGIMTSLDIPIQMMISLVPGIVLILSATEIIHIFSSFNYALDKGSTPYEALYYIGQDIGKALFLTFTTTALGFLSIRFSDILLLQEFALVSFMALVLAFFLTILYFPLHIRFFQRDHEDNSGDSSHYKSNPIFEMAQNYFIRFYYQTFQSKKIVVILILIGLINGLLALNLYVDNDAYAMLSDSTQVKKEINYFKDKMGGTKNIHIVLSAQEKSFEDPKLLSLLWKIHKELEKVSDVVHVESFAGIMALLNREMMDGKAEYLTIPESKNLIAQYMLTLSRDDLDPLISTDKKTINIKLAHDVSSSRHTAKLVGQLNEVLQSFSSEKLFTYYLTSRNILNLHAANTFVTAQVNSLVTMAIIIILLLSLFFKSLKIGLISLIPNLFPIFGLFGIMVIFDIPLNVGTCIIAAITIGIAADDTIHLFSRYFIDENKNHNPIISGTLTIEEEVIPIITTSLSLALSFLCFGLSSFIPLVEFGLLSAYVLILAVISDLYIGPVILAHFISKEKGLGSFKIPLLINAPTLKNSRIFHNFNNQELYTTISAGKLLVLNKGKHSLNKLVKEKETYFIVLRGNVDHFDLGSPISEEIIRSQQPSILLQITKSNLIHLSPRIFDKFCNNLKN